MFLSTPSVLSVIDEGIDISFFYNFAEEEEVEKNEIFNEMNFFISKGITVVCFANNSSLESNFQIRNSLKFTNLSHKIFSPPPNIFLMHLVL
jgi:hypothetical protein